MQDSDRAASQIVNEKLRAYIIAARQACENWCNRVFVTQRWLAHASDGFPGKNWRYNWNGYPAAIPLPNPPFQSVDFMRYVDVSGVVQDLPFDTSYGSGSLQYGYQLYRGTEVAPARIYSSWFSHAALAADPHGSLECDGAVSLWLRRPDVTCKAPMTQARLCWTVTGGLLLAFLTPTMRR